MSLRGSLYPRLLHWRAILGKRLAAFVLLIYGVLGAITWIRDELIVRKPGQTIWHVADFIPSGSLAGWLAVGLFLVVCVLLEGSFRESGRARDAYELERQKEFEAAKDSIAEQSGEYDQEIERLTTEIESLNSQLVIPKLVPVVTRFEVLERQGDPPLAGNVGFLVGLYTNNFVMIRVHLKISNEHRIATRIGSFGIAVFETSSMDSGKLFGVPTVIPEQMLQPIHFGLPLEGWIAFLLEHTDSQAVVRKLFSVSIVDGLDQTYSTPPQKIHRVDPNRSGPENLPPRDS